MAKSPKRPGRQDLERWHELEIQRIVAQRTARRCAQEQAPIASRCEAWMRAVRPKVTTAKVCGFVLAITSKRSAIKWRDTLLAVAGAEAIDQAERDAPVVQKFSIAPPAE